MGPGYALRPTLPSTEGDRTADLPPIFQCLWLTQSQVNQTRSGRALGRSIINDGDLSTPFAFGYGDTDFGDWLIPRIL